MAPSVGRNTVVDGRVRDPDPLRKQACTRSPERPHRGPRMGFYSSDEPRPASQASVCAISRSCARRRTRAAIFIATTGGQACARSPGAARGGEREQRARRKSRRPTLASGPSKPRQRPTLPQTCACSTIGPEELNFRVRDGNGCDLFGVATRKKIKRSAKPGWLGVQRCQKRALVSRLIVYIAEVPDQVSLGFAI